MDSHSQIPTTMTIITAIMVMMISLCLMPLQPLRGFAEPISPEHEPAAHAHTAPHTFIKQANLLLQNLYNERLRQEREERQRQQAWQEEQERKDKEKREQGEGRQQDPNASDTGSRSIPI